MGEPRHDTGLAQQVTLRLPHARGSVRAFFELPSTNDYLKAAARQQAQPWTAAIARRQSAGRGRAGNAWQSPEGNLSLSVLVPPVPRDKLTILPLAVGVAVHRVAQSWGVVPQLKWPNDLLVHGHKLGGILCEVVGDGDALAGVVVGIGINLAVGPAQLDPDARPAISVEAVTGQAPSVAAAAASILGEVALCYDALVASTPAQTVEAWMACSVPWWGRAVEVQSGPEVIVGVAEGIDTTGALLVRAPNGSSRRILSGEARALRPIPSEG